MTTKYSTKKALIASVLMLAICFTSLIGTTFAWFTDSATSANNIIKSGNLDVEMYWANGTKAVPAIDSTDWTDASTGAIFNNDKWEPGYVEVRHIKIANVGTLALKYKIAIVANGTVSDLSDVIDVYYVDPAVQVSDRAQLTDANKLGTLTEVLANLANTANGELLAGENDTITLALKMQETAGNKYQNKSIGTNFSVQLLATQMTAESDSFGPEYDGDAAFQVFVNTVEELEYALETAAPGTEIVLDGDITVTAPIVISAPAATTFSSRSTPAFTVIDLNGNSINAAYAEGSTTNHLYAFTNNGNLLLKNGTVNARGIFNYGNMIVENATINAIDGNGGYAVRNYSGSSFVMNGGKIATTLEDDHKVNNGGYDATTLRVDAGAYAEINGGIIDNICDWTFAIDNAGTVVVNDGIIKSVHSTVSNYGTLTVNGGSFTCDGLEGVTAHALVAWNGSTTTVNGGTFDGKDNYNGFNVNADKGADVVINGGNFLSVHSGSLYGKGNITVMGGVFFDAVSGDRLAEGFTCTQNADGTWTVSSYDGAIVSTVAELKTALESGGNVLLAADVDLTETITIPSDKIVKLDLNGKTITAPDVTFGTGICAIQNQGTLTVTGNGTIKGSYTALYSNGNLTIESGNFVATDGFGVIIDNIYGTEASVAVINGGTFTGVGIYNPTDVTVNGGTFNVGRDPDGASDHLSDEMTLFISPTFVGAPNTANVVLNGGTFNGDVYVYDDGITETVFINNGATITGDVLDNN